jgi:hypothetical protein
LRIEPTTDSARDLDRLIERSKRSSGARLPPSFARGDGSGAPPLAQLVQGGQGGEVRLKLYVSMVLLAGSVKSHKTLGRNAIANVSASTWARLLALPDPSGNGARRVADAQNELARVKLIKVQRQPGQPPRVSLLHASGSGGSFAEPPSPYIRIPLNLWEHRWLWTLTSKELAVLIALIDLCGGKGRDGSGGPQALSGIDRSRYGLSEDTWRISSASLVRHGLLTTDIMRVRFDLETARLRKRYALNLGGLAVLAPISVISADHV